MPTRRKSRRRKRSPLPLALFLIVIGCCAGGAALWLWSPDDAPLRAGTARVRRTPEPPARVASEPVTPSVAATPATVAGAPAPGRATAPPTPRVSLAAELPAVSRPTAAAAGRPRLAIIIDDCGQWPETERAFLALPFPLTLSVLPHVRFGSAIARDADAAGKGVMLHLPMETISGRDPGPGTITVAMPDAAIRSELAGDLAELPQAQGVNNHEGSLATQSTRVMGDIADVLAQSGRFFIDSRTSSSSVAEAVARERGVPSARRNVFLDNIDTQAAVETQLLEAEKDAQTNGSAIAIGHPRAATLAAVRELGPKFEADGVELTLASALVH